MRQSQLPRGTLPCRGVFEVLSRGQLSVPRQRSAAQTPRFHVITNRGTDHGNPRPAREAAACIVIVMVTRQIPQVTDTAWANRGFHQRAAKWM